MSSDAERDPAQPHPALESRRRDVARARARRRRMAVLAGIGVVVCALAGYWLATGPVLTVNSVTLEGYHGPDAAQLASAVTAAAEKGGSLLSPPVGNMTEVAQRFPGVKTITVSRDWPLGLTVHVIPAPPAAIVGAKGERSVVVSARGLVMGLAPKHLNRPSIVLYQPIPAYGKPLPSWAMQVLGFLAVLEPHTRNRVEEITYSQGQLTAQLVDGPALVLGALNQLPEKAAAINAVLAAIPEATERRATYLDVSVPERPALGGVGG